MPTGGLDPAIAIFPGLAEQAAERGMLPTIDRLAPFRGAGRPVVHVHAADRPDFGAVVPNSLIAVRSKKIGAMVEGTPAVEPMEAPFPSRVITFSARHSGVGMWFGTNLDATLRNLGVSTIVLCGVSTNVACSRGRSAPSTAGTRSSSPRMPRRAPRPTCTSG